MGNILLVCFLLVVLLPAFAAWVADHRANVYTIKQRIRGYLGK